MHLPEELGQWLHCCPCIDRPDRSDDQERFVYKNGLDRVFIELRTLQHFQGQSTMPTALEK